MNRFFDIQGIASCELMPWESAKRGLSKTTGVFMLLESNFRFRSDIAGGIIKLPYGFISDLASIPTAVAWAVMDSDDQRISGGAWFHDYLYRNGGCVPVYDEDGGVVKFTHLSQRQCDSILCDEAMPDLGASWLDRKKVSTGLLIGGWANFKKQMT